MKLTEAVLLELHNKINVELAFWESGVQVENIGFDENDPLQEMIFPKTGMWYDKKVNTVIPSPPAGIYAHFPEQAFQQMKDDTLFVVIGGRYTPGEQMGA